MKKIAICLFIVLFSFVSILATGKDNGQESGSEEKKVLKIFRIDQDVHIDGKLDEPFYEDITPSNGFYQYAPKNGSESTYETSIYAYYDKNNIYFAFKCYDDEPDKIAADLTPFGEYFYNDDIKIYLDTFNDKETYDMFAVNPKGVKSGKETVWDADARITTDGWQVEVKIPFKSLRFPVREIQDWRINFRRVVHRLNEVSFWTPFKHEKSSVFGDTFGILEGLKGIEGGRNLEVFPYAGLRNSFSGDEKDNKFAYGLDLKYGVTSNLTLDVTSSPDYSEVESDPFFYQTSPFEVLLSERRPFYQEGSGYFDTNFYLFYSRRIADPLLAAKITGKEKGFSLGALGAINENKSTGHKDFHGVFRLKKDIFKMSYVGAIYSAKEEGDNWNRNAGLDFKLTFLENFKLSGMAAFSFNKDQPRANNGMYQLMFQHSVGKGLSLVGRWCKVEPGVNVPAGYVANTDYEELLLIGKYIFQWEENWLQNLTFMLFVDHRSSVAERLKVQKTYEFLIEFATRSRLYLTLSRQVGKKRPRIYDENCDLLWDDTFYPNTFYFAEFYYSGSSVWSLDVYGISIDQYVYNDEFTQTKEGKFIEGNFSVVFKFTPRFKLSFNYGKTYYRSLDRSIEFDGNLISSTLSIQLNKKISSFVKFQYDSYQERFQYDFLIGYEPANVSRIYLSIKNYSEDRFRLFSPEARSIAFKVSYLLRF